MGERGPLPQPDNLRVLRGNPSKTAAPPPTPRAVSAIPTAPSWLNAEAKAEWKRVTPELHRMGLLAKLDRAVLTLYCESWALAVDALRKMRADGLLVGGAKSQQVKHPAWQLYRDASTQTASLAKELGLSPNARGRMKAPTPEPGDDSDLD